MLNSRIVLLRTNTGKPVNLMSDFYPACDPDVSFDGRKIMLAGKSDVYNLFAEK
jgi:Tol biopolymer transport system component